MTMGTRFERDLPDLLADLYPESAPSYRDDIVRRIATTRQRPAWTFPERWLPMGVITLTRQTISPVPWRTFGLLAALALLLAAAMALYVGGQRRLPPAFGPAANGALVVGDGGDIYLIDPATGDRTLAIGGPTIDSDPVFSRDGTRFAFYREDGGRRGLFVADAHGQGVAELSTTGLADVGAIDWSPDGSSILVSGNDTRPGTVAIVPVDGSAARVLDFAIPVEDAVWVPPDGREILFRTPGEVPNVYGLVVARADGTGSRMLVPPPGTAAADWSGLYFAPSPDGSEVAFQWRDESGTLKIFLVPAAGGTPRAITTVESVLPRWSPDGARIAFAGPDGFYAVGTGDPAPQTRLVAGSRGLLARWAPDGTHLVLLTDGGKMLLVDPTGGPSVEATWSATSLPDWQRLAAP